MACKEAADIHTFSHRINLKTLNHMRRLVFSNNPFCRQLRYYFESNSITVCMFKDKFEKLYGIREIFNNDADALHSRIKFIEDREEISSWHSNIR